MIRTDDILKGLTTFAIEKTLLDIGRPAHQKVVERLYKKYHCYLPDCFEKPEYLKTVLQEIYGNSYKEIIKSIHEELDEFIDKKNVEKFLQVLSK